MTIQQKIEKIQSYKDVKTKVDGIWGPNTARAVATVLGASFDAYTMLSTVNKQIQRKLNVHVDGIVGHITCDAIIENLYPKEKEIVTNDGFIEQKKGSYDETFQQTPNYTKGATINPIGIVLHHSCGSFTGSVSWCLDTKSAVSYHCMINLDGSRFQLAKDNQRAWHAGKSSFNGKSDCNGFMLGLSFSGDTNKRTLTKDEVASAVEWIIERIEKYDWPKNLSTITTHRAVSPGRKDDVDERAEKAILDALKKKIK